MLFFVVLICLSITVCQADKPKDAVYCGAMPKIYQCLDLPDAVRKEASAQCRGVVGECEKMTCIATKLGWMKENKLDKEKFSADFDLMAKENPDWQMAVDHIKTACVVDLPPQGIYFNCPAYDAMLCSFNGLVKYAKPSKWLSSAECDYPRKFAAACPVCPPECLAPTIPAGSCKVCLPRTP